MDIKNQVCSIEQGEKLERLGLDVKPLLCYCWVSTGMDSRDTCILPTDWKLEGLDDLATTWLAPAFNSAELGVLLPDLISTDLQYEMCIVKESDDTWLCRYVRGNNLLETLYTEGGKTEADVKAKMLIGLLSGRIITVEDCLERFNNA